MRTIIDIRPLLDPQRSGVGHFTAEISRALIARSVAAAAAAAGGSDDVESGHIDYTLFANGRPSTFPEDFSLRGRHYSSSFSHYPNRLLNAAFAFAGRPLIESLAGPADVLYLPNLNFMATRLPYVVTVHDLSFVRFPQYFSAKQRLWHRLVDFPRKLRGAAAVTAVSEHTRRDLLEMFSLAPERVHVVTPATDHVFEPQPEETVERVRREYGLRSPYFLFLGTLEPRKNVLGLIEAFDLLGEDADVDLVIAGGRGWLNGDVYRRAATSPKRRRIRFLGYAAQADKPALYAGALALTYPSFYEGFGMPPLEAMRCGTPVIASHTSSLGEVVGDAGLLVNPLDPRELAAAMRRVLAEPGLRATLRARGLERAARFSWDESAARLEAIFRGVSAG